MTAPSLDALLSAAQSVGGTIVRTPAAVVVVIPTATEADPEQFLSLDEARALGKFKTTRPIKDAGRAGALTLYGTERTRTVKRGEFLAWLESRRAPVATGPDDLDVERRMRRLARRKRAA
jgi:hypothetical protein